jgi:two-component system, OmpR family, alkaline phosphatase synthesis response regulator PhoP
MIKQLILVVEDELSIQNVIRTYLESAGFRVACVDDGREALVKLHELDPVLVILDLNLPSMDGMEVAARMREVSQVYILMLTARSEEADRVAGLRLGADDYLVKPFSPRELVARVEAVLRRGRPTAVSKSNRLTFDQLSIDPDSYEVEAGGQQIELTSTEFSLLWELARHHGRVLSRDQLLSRVWGEEFYGNDRVVDVYVGQVRRKLEAATGQTLIETVRGVGYKFKG